MKMKSKQFLLKRKDTVINLRNLLSKRTILNLEIKSLQKELKGLDNYLTNEDIENWN